jgi:hypothetical protein
MYVLGKEEFEKWIEALFVSRKVNSWNSLSLFFNV